MIPNSSVWSRAHNEGSHDRKEPERRSGRLVAVTATGPIYWRKVGLAVVPVSVGLALVQELTIRSINPKSRVVSSLANRVAGDTALSAWTHTCGFAAGVLIGASPRARLSFLSKVLAYVRREGNANGIEPILGAAVNAAWPWIEPNALARILDVSAHFMRSSEFASSSTIPIVDPNTRTFTLFAPGELAKLDPKEWLDRRALEAQDNAAHCHEQNVGLPNRFSGPDLRGIGGPDLSGSGDGGPTLGMFGMGRLSGPDLTGIGGPDLRGRGDEDPLGMFGMGRFSGPDNRHRGPRPQWKPRFWSRPIRYRQWTRSKQSGRHRGTVLAMGQALANKALRLLTRWIRLGAIREEFGALAWLRQAHGLGRRVPFPRIPPGRA